MAITKPQGIGQGGQTWVDMTASRAKGTTYTNTTSKPILCSVSAFANSAIQLRPTVNGLDMGEVNSVGSTIANVGFAVFIVPPGQTYSVAMASGAAVNKWNELR